VAKRFTYALARGAHQLFLVGCLFKVQLLHEHLQKPPEFGSFAQAAANRFFMASANHQVVSQVCRAHIDSFQAGPCCFGC
jgi:hypothetical protein